MADEAIKTPDTEVKEVKEEVKQDDSAKPKEGSIEAEIAKDSPKDEPKKEAETVPLAVFLDLKQDFKELKKSIETANKEDKRGVAVSGVNELAAKYPDVDKGLLEDLLSSATANAEAKLNEKFSPILERQEAERKQQAFDKAFDKLYEKTLSENPDLPKTIDKELVKTLAVTSKYRNVPLADILTQMYGGVNEGKSSSESAMRASSDRVEDMVSFDNITPDQKKAIMADDKIRAKYFNWLDSQ